MEECISCGSRICAVKFPCPKCKKEIGRCEKCRKISIEYKCDCGYVGP